MTRRLVAKAALALCILAFLAAAAHAAWIKDGNPVCPAAGDQGGLSAIPDGAGGAIIAWMDQRAGGNPQTYAQRITPAGTASWIPGGVLLCGDTGGQWRPCTTSDGAGGAIVAWEDGRLSWDIYAQRVHADGTVLWAAGGVPVCDYGWTQAEACIISDGAGGAIIVWRDGRSGNLDIYAQRIDPDGASLWTEDGVALVTQPGSQYSPQIMPDGSGGAIVAWLDDRNGYSDIYAQRISAAGAAQWAENGVAVCTEETTQYNIAMAANPSGAVIVWNDSRSGCYDVYAQFLDLDGGAQWAADGILVCDFVSCRYGPQVVAGEGLATIVAWYDDRADEWPVYAQCLDADGQRMWAAYGVQAFPSGGESEIRIAPDGSGGAILALDAYNATDSYKCDIYAQRISAGGEVMWPRPLGVGVCTADQNQYSPAVIPDTEGGGLIAWEDMRNGVDSDLYAQRLGGDGLWGSPEPSILSCADVPDDEGGWVRVTTRASSHDIAGEEDYPVEGYSLWRRTARPTGIAPEAGPERATAAELFATPEALPGTVIGKAQAALLGFPDGRWESVGFWFATRDTLYIAAAPTRSDSAEGGAGHEAFVVTAHTSTPGVFVISEPDSGYSLDNLAPGLTAGLTGDELAVPPGLYLTWLPNPAPDLWKYDIHRGPSEFFEPEESNRIGSVGVTEYFDAGWDRPALESYKLVAVDRHGNRGPAALLRPEDINVGTALQSYSASLSPGAIEIAWRLSEIDDGARFFILRSAGGAGFEELPSPAIEREGLSFTFSDRSVEPGTQYRYRVEIEEEVGRRILFETDPVTTPAMPLTLYQNRPNPFNPSTTIEFYLPERCAVTLEIYDASGRLVDRLLGGETRPAGTHSVSWRGSDSSGSPVASGVYFCRLRAGRETLSRKMVMLR